jgi:hypothetical protein
MLAKKTLKQIKLPGWRYAGADKSIQAEWVKEINGTSFYLQVSPFPVKYGKGTGTHHASFWAYTGGHIVNFGAPAYNFTLDTAKDVLPVQATINEDELFNILKNSNVYYNPYGPH